jgi:hypothetical protein
MTPVIHLELAAAEVAARVELVVQDLVHQLHRLEMVVLD